MDYLKAPLKGLSRRPSRSTTPEPSSADPDCPRPLSTTPDDNANHAIWTGLKTLAGVLSVGGDVLGPLKSATDAFVKFIEVSEATAETREEYQTLRIGIDRLFYCLAERFGEIIPEGMKSSIINLAKGIEREIMLIQPKEQRRGLGRYATALQDADQVLKCYHRVQTLLELLALNANVNIWMLVDEHVTCYRLDKLEPSHAAWYSSADSQKLHRDECTPDTRVQVLERFRVWRDDDEGEKVYWLNGMAGTGKTTLSYTLCKQLEEDSRLAANFFCSRQLPTCRDAKRILPTIAYQLANFSYPFRYALSRVLGQSPDVHTRRISEQFMKLLVNPLNEVRRSIPDNLVIVLEALDECDSPGEILDALLNHALDLPIRFFLTGRPEPEIRERMCARCGDRERFELHLHNLDKSIVGEDIKKYLNNGLKRANVSDEDLETLTERSGTLFIYAATVVRYVSAFSFSRSADRLEQVLSASTSSHDSDKEIDSLYTLILTNAFDDPKMIDREKEEMKLVLHTAICAQEPLSAHVMSGIIGLRRVESVLAALSPLRSVLNIQTADEGITTLHKSFPDYMFNQARSQRFYCDAAQHNAILTKWCFQLIGAPDPPFNICDWESSFVLDKDVPGLGGRIKRQISGELFYACRYWGTHLRLATISPSLRDQIHRLLSTRLLLWMEVMNLKQCLQPDGVQMISRVRDFMEDHDHLVEDRELIRDVYEFVNLYSIGPASRSTPHIYISALTFWAPQRPVSAHYSRMFQTPIQHAGLPAQPSQHMPLGIYSLGSSVRCIAFSPDGMSIAAGSDDSIIRVWDISTSQEIGTSLQSHGCPIGFISYLSNKMIISCPIGEAPGDWDTMNQSHQAIAEDTTQICGLGRISTMHGSALKFKLQPTQVVGSRKLNILSVGSSGAIRLLDRISETPKDEFQGHKCATCSCIRPSYNSDMIGRLERFLSKDRVETTSLASQTLYPTRVLTSRSDSVTTVTRREIQTDPEPRGYESTTFSLQQSSDNGYPVYFYLNQSLSESIDWTTISSTLQRSGPLLESSSGAMCSDEVRDILGADRSCSRPVIQSTCDKDFSNLRRITSTCKHQSYPQSDDILPMFSHPYTIAIPQSSEEIATAKSSSDEGIITRFVVVFSDRIRRLYGLKDGSIRIGHEENEKAGPESLLEGHTAVVTSLAYSSDGSQMVSGSADGTIRIWDPPSGKTVVGPLAGHNGPVFSVAYSADGTIIASGSADNTVCIWNARTGQIMQEPLKWHSPASHHVIHSTGSSPNTSFSENDVACFWDMESGRLQLGFDRQKVVSDVLQATYTMNPAQCSPSNKAAIDIRDQYLFPASGDPLRHDARKYVPACSSQAVDVVTATESEPSSLCWDSDLEGCIILNSTQLLFWTPQDVRDRIWHPQITGTLIHRENTLWIDLNTALVGTRWQQCYVVRQQDKVTSCNNVLRPNMQAKKLFVYTAVLIALSIVWTWLSSLVG